METQVNQDEFFEEVTYRLKTRTNFLKVLFSINTFLLLALLFFALSGSEGAFWGTLYIIAALVFSIPITVVFIILQFIAYIKARKITVNIPSNKSDSISNTNNHHNLEYTKSAFGQSFALTILLLACLTVVIPLGLLISSRIVASRQGAQQKAIDNEMKQEAQQNMQKQQAFAKQNPELYAQQQEVAKQQAIQTNTDTYNQIVKVFQGPQKITFAKDGGPIVSTDRKNNIEPSAYLYNTQYNVDIRNGKISNYINDNLIGKEVIVVLPTLDEFLQKYATRQTIWQPLNISYPINEQVNNLYIPVKIYINGKLLEDIYNK